jgi:hypothetical protein
MEESSFNQKLSQTPNLKLTSENFNNHQNGNHDSNEQYPITSHNRLPSPGIFSNYQNQIYLFIYLQVMIVPVCHFHQLVVKNHHQ